MIRTRGTALIERCQIYFPYDRDERAGGPCGFVSQNFAEPLPSGYAATPSMAHVPRNPLADFSAAARDGIGLQRLAPRGRHDLRRRQRFFRSGAHKSKALWFHDAGTYAEIADLIAREQIVLFQPHTPVKPWEEIEDDAETRRTRKEAAVAVFKRADHIVLPSRHCTEIYGDLIEAEKVTIVRSACAAPPAITPVPLDRSLTYLLYIGRRHAIKGFDLLLEGFRQAHERRPDIRLLLIGRGERVEQGGVLDLGPSQNIHDWIASVDCVVNMNRQSYFDLSVMETLAVGTPLIFSATGGHKDLVAHVCDDLVPIGATAAGLSAALLSFRRRKEEPNARLQQLWQDRYSLTVYRRTLADALPRFLSSSRTATAGGPDSLLQTLA